VLGNSLKEHAKDLFSIKTPFLLFLPDKFQKTPFPAFWPDIPVFSFFAIFILLILKYIHVTR